MRSRRVDVLETSKQKTTKQPVKGKTNTTPVHILSRSDPNPTYLVIEDVSDTQLNNRQLSNTLPPKGNVEEPPEVDSETTSAHNPTPEKERNTENTEEKENSTVRNTRT